MSTTTQLNRNNIDEFPLIAGIFLTKEYQKHKSGDFIVKIRFACKELVKLRRHNRVCFIRVWANSDCLLRQGKSVRETALRLSRLLKRISCAQHYSLKRSYRPKVTVFIDVAIWAVVVQLACSQHAVQFDAGSVVRPDRAKSGHCKNQYNKESQETLRFLRTLSRIPGSGNLCLHVAKGLAGIRRPPFHRRTIRCNREAAAATAVIEGGDA